MKGEGDAAIAVWASRREDGIYLMDSISSYILGGMYTQAFQNSLSGLWTVFTGRGMHLLTIKKSLMEDIIV